MQRLNLCSYSATLVGHTQRKQHKAHSAVAAVHSNSTKILWKQELKWLVVKSSVGLLDSHHFIIDLYYFDLHMYEAKLYTLWFTYIDNNSNNVLMCSVSNVRFSNMTFTCDYSTVEPFPSSDCRCVQNILNMETNAFIHRVKEASDGASTGLGSDTRFPFSAAASGKPRAQSHKTWIKSFFLFHTMTFSLFSFISAAEPAACLCKLALKHVLTESLTPFKH